MQHSKRFSCLLVLFTFIFTIQTKAQLSTEKQMSIDSIFQDWNTLDVPGASLGIIKDGKLIYAKGYGAANLEYDIPNSSKSIFRIASTSKQFTAACIILLSQEGKLSLDDKLSSFFPSFPAYAKSVTVRHLLNHTSGVRDYLVLAQLSGLEDDDYYANKTVMKWLKNQEELNFAPGEEFLYSNSGYWLLGQIVAKVSDTSMAAYAKEKIFDPLGMESTHFHDDNSRIVKNRASGYRMNRQGKFSISMTSLEMIGDGGIFTSIEDLKKWDDAFYESSILNKAFWKEMTTVGQLNSGEKLDYACGLIVGKHKGFQIIEHGGSFVGFRAEMIRFPEEQLSVIVLANRADARPSRMAYQVADLFLSPKPTTATENANEEPAATFEKPIQLSKKKLSVFEGTYWNDNRKFSRKLELREGALYYVRSNGSATKMEPIGERKFQWVGPDIPIILEFTDEKKSKSFELRIPGDEVSVFSAYTPVESFTEEELESYSGDYYSSELDIVYTLKKIDGGIVLFVKGEEAAPLSPVMNHLLSLYSYMTFEFNEDYTEFRLSLGRVKNMKFVKK